MKSIAYLFYLSAVCTLVSLCWMNRLSLVYCLFEVTVILPIAAYFIKTFRHNPIRIWLFIYLCFAIAGIGFTIYEINNSSSFGHNENFMGTVNIFRMVNVLYTLLFSYIILRLIKRFSLVWWAFVGVVVAIVLQNVIPLLPFWDDFILHSDSADRHRMFEKWMLLGYYISTIAYIVLRISIGYALMPKSLKK